LSYEGGEFILNYVESVSPEIKNQLQIAQLDEQGEKAFLYGADSEMDRITSDTNKLEKHKLIFIFNQNMTYIGLGLLFIKQAGSTKNDNRTGLKQRDEFSRSKNFMLKIMNLTDAGHFLRDGF
jgi:ribosome biogenesis protein Nip4